MYGQRNMSAMVDVATWSGDSTTNRTPGRTAARAASIHTLSLRLPEDKRSARSALSPVRTTQGSDVSSFRQQQPAKPEGDGDIVAVTNPHFHNRRLSQYRPASTEAPPSLRLGTASTGSATDSPAPRSHRASVLQLRTPSVASGSQPHQPSSAAEPQSDAVTAMQQWSTWNRRKQDVT